MKLGSTQRVGGVSLHTGSTEIFGQVSKYGNTRCRMDGYLFDSLSEMERYKQLKLIATGGSIIDLRVHSRWPLDVNGTRVATYESDFDYLEGDKKIVEDTKGVSTAVFKLKIKLMKALHPDIELRIIKT